jgi:hypothetical protein
MKDTYSATFKGARDYNARVLEFAHVNINAAFEHARKWRNFSRYPMITCGNNSKHSPDRLKNSSISTIGRRTDVCAPLSLSARALKQRRNCDNTGTGIRFPTFGITLQ